MLQRISPSCRPRSARLRWRRRRRPAAPGAWARRCKPSCPSQTEGWIWSSGEYPCRLARCPVCDDLGRCRHVDIEQPPHSGCNTAYGLGSRPSADQDHPIDGHPVGAQVIDDCPDQSQRNQVAIPSPRRMVSIPRVKRSSTGVVTSAGTARWSAGYGRRVSGPMAGDLPNSWVTKPRT